MHVHQESRELGDFTVTPRVLFISSLAVVVGASTAVVALGRWCA